MGFLDYNVILLLEVDRCLLSLLHFLPVSLRLASLAALLLDLDILKLGSRGGSFGLYWGMALAGTQCMLPSWRPPLPD